MSPSPPPVLSVTDEPDESDEPDEPDENVENVPLKNSPQHLQSPPTIYSGYQRTKSQSAKLTRDANISCPKKAVRFADDFGLELSQMRMINTDELPYVPSEAFKHLQISNDCNLFDHERVKVITYMEPQFENPIHTQGFNDRVSRYKIVLEEASKSIR